jgi:hypothetical protein
VHRISSLGSRAALYPALRSGESKEQAMPQTAILGPVYAMFFLTFIVWVYLYARRIPFLLSLERSPNDLTPARLAELSPPAVSNPSDNLKNLFELPVIFYALSLALFATGRDDSVYVGAAWVFVAFRALHSAMHCTANIVIVRFYLYLISSLALWFMAGRAALAYLGS